MSLVWVERLTATIRQNGVAYGPSTTPLQVPEALAAYLGLRVVDAPEGPEDAEAEATASARVSELEARVAELEGLLETGNSTAQTQALQVTELTKQRDALLVDLAAAQARASELEAQPTADSAELATLHEAVGTLQQQLAEAQARVAELENAPSGLNLPPDALERLIAVDGIGEKRAQAALDALAAPAPQE